MRNQRRGGASDRLDFKFRWAGHNGGPLSLWGRPGTLDDDWLVLDHADVPTSALIRSTRRMERLILRIRGQDHARARLQQAWGESVHG